MFRKQAEALAQRETSKDEIVFQTFVQGARVYGTCSNHDSTHSTFSMKASFVMSCSTPTHTPFSI